VTPFETGRVLINADERHGHGVKGRLGRSWEYPHWRYEQSELQMRCGDKLLVFTDGLVEASNTHEELFLENNLILIARQNPTSGTEELMRLLIHAASQHSGEHFEDDATFIVLKATERTRLHLDGELE
jgi:hypothetical protein